MIWLRAGKAAGLGFLAECFLGFLYGIVMAVSGSSLQLVVMLVILFVTYLFTGFVAARGSDAPFTTAGLAGFLLAFFNLLLTKMMMGMIFLGSMLPLGFVLMIGIALLGGWIYQLVRRSRDSHSALSGGERDESLEG